MNIAHLKISDIEVGQRVRPVDAEKVQVLADDIAEKGQLQPIGVRVDGDGYDLIFGAHRLAAHELLGKPLIEAKILSVTPLQGRVIEITENIIRTNFRPLEFADAMARHKELYETAYPESKNGAKGLIAMNTPDDNSPERKNSDLVKTVQSFTENVAEKFDVSRSKIEKALWLAAHINRNAIQMLKACGIREDQEHKILDNASQLHALAKHTPEDQEKISKHMAENPESCKSVADAWSYLSGRVEPSAQEKTFTRLMDGWGRFDTAAKRDFLTQLSFGQLPEGFRIITPEDADG